MASITFNNVNEDLEAIYFIDDSESTCTLIGDYSDAVDYFPDDAAVGDSVVFSMGGSSGKGKYQGLNFTSGNTGDYMHECDFSGCTTSPINPWYVSNYDNQVMDFVDCNWGEFIDVEKVRWWNSAPAFYPDYYETYSMLLKVIDKDDNGISGAIVDLEDVNGAETFNYTTNTDGYLGREDGAISSATASTLTDSGKSWSSNEWWFQEVYITSGLGVGQRRIIKKGNTGIELQVAPDWNVTPDNTSKYVIIPYIRIMRFTPAALTPSAYVWSAVTDYNPFILTISANGYRMHREKLVLDKKADWQIKLNHSPYTIA